MGNAGNIGSACSMSNADNMGIAGKLNASNKQILILIYNRRGNILFLIYISQLNQNVTYCKKR